MQVLKSTRSILKKDLLLKSYFATANPITAQYEINQFRNAIRFENQNRTWTQEELNKHSSAFAYGLVEMGYKQGDKLLLWVEKANTAEIVGAQLGAAQAGVTIIPTYAKTAEELESAIKGSQCTGVLYSPNSPASAENVKYSDLIQSVVPQLAENGNFGKQLKSDKFPKLKYVVHTGFYTQPGQYKFRDVLVYASKNFNTLSLPELSTSVPFMLLGNKSYTLSDLVNKTGELRNSHQVEDKTVVVTGDAKAPLSFALGALNATLNGNYTIYTGNSDLTSVGRTLEVVPNTVFVLDGELADGVSSLGWEQSAQDSVQSVALLNRGGSVDVNSLFAGKQNSSYELSL